MADEPNFVSLLPVQIVEVNGGTIVRRGSTQLLVRGAGTRPIVELIFALAAAGGTSASELVQVVGARHPGIPAEKIEALFQSLIGSRFLTQGDERSSPVEPSDPGRIVAWDFGVETAPPLSDRRIAIAGNNALATAVVEAFSRCGISQIERIADPALSDSLESGEPAATEAPEWCADESDAELLIAATPLGNQHALRKWNRIAVASGRPFLPVLLADHCGQIGPLVQPGDGPCLECLRARQNAAADRPDLVRAPEETVQATPGVVGFLPPMLIALAELAALECIKHMLNPRIFDTVGHVIYFDWLEPSLSLKKVLKIPRCTVCSATSEVSAIRLSRNIPIPAEEH